MSGAVGVVLAGTALARASPPWAVRPAPFIPRVTCVAARRGSSTTTGADSRHAASSVLVNAPCIWYVPECRGTLPVAHTTGGRHEEHPLPSPDLLRPHVRPGRGRCTRAGPGHPGVCS